jgi:hypothetical protein
MEFGIVDGTELIAFSPSTTMMGNKMTMDSDSVLNAELSGI